MEHMDTEVFFKTGYTYLKQHRNWFPVPINHKSQAKPIDVAKRNLQVGATTRELKQFKYVHLCKYINIYVNKYVCTKECIYS